MAFIGLRKPIIGKLKEDGTYETPINFGRAISMEITPNYAEGSLYADDGLAEYDKEFKDADVTLGTDTIPIEAREPMFGHAVDAEKKVTTYKGDDQSNYVGTGIVGIEKVNGKRIFTAAFLPKVKYVEPSDSLETKGDNITYKTPTITGKATVNERGEWKETAVFEKESEALDWIDEKFGKATSTLQKAANKTN